MAESPKKSTAKTSAAPAKKASATKAPAKQASATKAPAKKTSAKKTSAKKASAKKTSAKKTPAKQTSATKAPAKKASSTKAPAKKAPAKKAPAKKTSAKKSSAKKAPAKKTSATNRASTGVTEAEAARKAARAPESRFFDRAVSRARKLVDDPTALRSIAERANKSGSARTGPFAAVLDDFRTLVRLVVAYARGHYREIAPDQLAVVVGGLLYVVSPLDLIPDAIPGFGFLDDAYVVGYVIKSVREELDAFREWEQGSSDTA